MSDPANPTPAPRNDTGAIAALAGYDFQLNVSILAALRILFVTKSATRITLEPANAEDIEVELEDDDPGHVQTQAHLSGTTRLIMQVKMRGGDPWVIATFERLLKHGKRRAPAKDHLIDPDVRYLLVTNADVSGEARNLLVEDFEETASSDDFPPSLHKILPNAPQGRVAIYAGLTPKLLAFEIAHILTDILRIPKDRQAPCLVALREEARMRMRGSSPGVWAYNDLLGTIRGHGGFLASVAELDAFVEPTNFPDMVRQLEKKNAVVIAGSSGTGKTLAARALCDLARKRNGALDIVVVPASGDPTSIRQIVQTGPKLFYLEDPWGQNSLRAGSETWTEQLPRMLRGAHAGNQFVVTSRSDVLHGAQADDGLAPWSIELEADRYLDGRLGKIYDKRMDFLPPELQSKALNFRSDVLQALEKPLELDLFFANILSGRDEDEKDREWLQRLIGLAHRDAVEGVVDRFLTQADKNGQAAVIWGLLAARGSFDRVQLIALMRVLRNIAPSLGFGLDKLVDTMIAARHLRQPTTSVAFAHPSVRAGFERYCKADWLRHESAFEALLIALTTLPLPYSSWGMETAARLIEEARRLIAEITEGAFTFDVPPSAQAAIDGWLETALLDPGADFPKLLQLASDVGSPTSNPAELARWLLTSAKRGASFFLGRWQEPTFPDDWYARIAQDTRSFPIAERFVRDQLSDEHGSYSPAFVTALDRIATGLEGAYLEAAYRLVGTGYRSNVDIVVTGALRNLPAFKAVFDAALDELVPDAATMARIAEQSRAIDDGECDYGTELYHSLDNEDEGYASSVIVEHYIKAVRGAGDWQALANHGRAAIFAYYWAKEIRDADPEAPPSFEEIAAMVAVARSSGREEDAWDALRHHWHSHFRETLKQFIIVGVPDKGSRHAAIACAIQVDKALLAEVFAALLTPTSRVAFICDLIEARPYHSRKKRVGLRDLLEAMEAPFQEIARTLLRGASRSAPLSCQSIAALEQAALTVPPRILSKIVPLLLRVGRASNQVIQRWLNETEDKDLAAEAASAAVEIKDEAAIALALSHRRADARVIALRYLTSQTSPPFPAKLLMLAVDPGRRVRQALLKALVAKPHPDHLPVLLLMTDDTWSDADPSHNEDDRFPIAHQAVAALAAYAPLSDQICDALLKLTISTSDRRLAQTCLQIAADHGSPATRAKIKQIVRGQDRATLRLDALDALALATSIEPQLVAPFTAEQIMKLGPAFATSAVVLVCRHASLAKAVAVCERMVHSNEHRSLAVLGAFSLHDRKPAAARAILDLLPPNHPARRLFDNGEALLPASTLDGLGSVKLQRWVQKWLSLRIAKA